MKYLKKIYFTIWLAQFFCSNIIEWLIHTKNKKIQNK